MALHDSEEATPRDLRVDASIRKMVHRVQVHAGRDRVARVIGQDVLGRPHVAVHHIPHVEDGADRTRRMLEDYRPGRVGEGVQLAVLRFGVLMAGRPPHIGEVGAVVRRPIAVAAEHSRHVGLERQARRLLHQAQRVVADGRLRLELVVVDDEPLAAGDAIVPADVQIGPVDACVGQPVDGHDVHEVRNVRVRRKLRHAIVQSRVEHLQAGVHGREPAVHHVEVVGAADAPGVRAEGDELRGRVRPGQDEVVVLEHPGHLAVVVPGRVADEEVPALGGQAHEGGAVPVLGEAQLPVAVGG
mmetsp:Transcript_78036/g.218746  ORF Transcript_78036/g.218746 Transcript_78036/m.218746 type:complete len:300 (+) Transcript_78036:246-1145(+)